MKYTYLACPYSHPNPATRELRTRIADDYAARLMAAGHRVFSPLSHSHRVAEFLPTELLMDHDFWMKQDLPILAGASLMVILTLEGWTTSKGIAEEIEFAEARSIPVVHMSLYDLPQPPAP